jgi:hypothetical protein
MDPGGVRRLHHLSSVLIFYGFHLSLFDGIAIHSIQFTTSFSDGKSTWQW